MKNILKVLSLQNNQTNLEKWKPLEENTVTVIKYTCINSKICGSHLTTDNSKVMGIIGQSRVHYFIATLLRQLSRSRQVQRKSFHTLQ